MNKYNKIGNYEIQERNPVTVMRVTILSILNMLTILCLWKKVLGSLLQAVQ